MCKVHIFLRCGAPSIFVENLEENIFEVQSTDNIYIQDKIHPKPSLKISVILRLLEKASACKAFPPQKLGRLSREGSSMGNSILFHKI
jgi:hypothetical protein